MCVNNTRWGNTALLFCPCGVPLKKSIFQCLQISASNFDNLFLCTAPLIIHDKRGCHIVVLSDCDHSAVISSCGSYMLGTQGSDCFSPCGCSISGICILLLHLKHLTSRLLTMHQKNFKCFCFCVGMCALSPVDSHT